MSGETDALGRWSSLGYRRSFVPRCAAEGDDNRRVDGEMILVWIHHHLIDLLSG